MRDDDDEVFEIAGYEVARVRRARLTLAIDEVAASLERGFVLESEGVTLPWKTPMTELERFAPTYRLEAYGRHWDGEFGWSDVVALGGIALPVVFVTDTRGVGVFESLTCLFPSDLESSDAGTELFERCRAQLEARLGLTDLNTSVGALRVARWTLGAVRAALCTIALPISGTDFSRTSLHIGLDSTTPFTRTESPSVVSAGARAPASADSAPLVQMDPRPPLGLPSRRDGLRDVRVAHAPILEATWRLAGPDAPPCVERDFRLQRWFVGSGVRAAEHPFVLRGDGFLAREMLRSVCGACGGDDVRVLAFQTSASMGGDCYYDLELRCLTCGAYTAFAYCDR